ncbi:barstar family protein [Lysinibacillus sp. NPDC095746]|uniref:barstar family protein n=1 Tax=Lysinibacillus sp. NPDC095746 TaxID=3364134 RepID=UPI0038080B79
MQENNFYPMIDGKNCPSVESLFKEFAINIKFPDYFGENWAAFDECMNDLDWLNCEKYVLFIKNFDQLLSREMHNEFEIFIDILKTMVDEWATERKYSLLSPNTISFQVVIHSEKGIKDL